MKRLIRICFLFLPLFLPLFLLPVLLGCRSTAPKTYGDADSDALPLSDYLAARQRKAHIVESELAAIHLADIFYLKHF